MTETMKHRQMKEEGNNFFKANKYEEALSCYTKALNLGRQVGSECSDSDMAVYYKNRAATYLKLKDYKAAIQDTDEGEFRFTW